jgi:hypothetical protein
MEDRRTEDELRYQLEHRCMEEEMWRKREEGSGGHVDEEGRKGGSGNKGDKGTRGSCLQVSIEQISQVDMIVG